MARSKSLLPFALMLGAGFFVIATIQVLKTNQLEQRIHALEGLMGQKQMDRPFKTDRKAPSGPIKSITLRTGTNDDRLRIYWADGSNSDLPCTQEQSTKEQWACG